MARFTAHCFFVFFVFFMLFALSRCGFSRRHAYMALLSALPRFHRVVTLLWRGFYPAVMLPPRCHLSTFPSCVMLPPRGKRSTPRLPDLQYPRYSAISLYRAVGSLPRRGDMDARWMLA